ncbi:MAG: ABC transporter permease [Dialister invisus]
MAFDSIFSNKMRSLLTMLGIIIGVAAVIALMSLGYGVRADIENNIASLGSNQITIIPGTSRKPGVRPAAGSMQSLTYKDYLAVRIYLMYLAAPLVSNSYVAVMVANWTTMLWCNIGLFIYF